MYVFTIYVNAGHMLNIYSSLKIDVVFNASIIPLILFNIFTKYQISQIQYYEQSKGSKRRITDKS